MRLLQKSCASFRLTCAMEQDRDVPDQIIPYSYWSKEISVSGRTPQRKYHYSEERVLAQISAMNRNNSLGADDTHPGVQRQLTYETAQLLSELSKCHLNHHSARATGKCNQTLKRIQDEWLCFFHAQGWKKYVIKMEVVDSGMNICRGWVNIAFTEPEIQSPRGLWRSPWWPSRYSYLSCSYVHWIVHAGVGEREKAVATCCSF